MRRTQENLEIKDGEKQSVLSDLFMELEKSDYDLVRDRLLPRQELAELLDYAKSYGIKLFSFIGAGFNRAVFKAEFNNKNYALKIPVTYGGDYFNRFEAEEYSNIKINDAKFKEILAFTKDIGNGLVIQELCSSITSDEIPEDIYELSLALREMWQEQGFEVDNFEFGVSVWDGKIKAFDFSDMPYG
ncbi:hypothetical protein D6827_00235 [Candidatus Parcubacteria bacterium]|nr:MAG: hypothetical protein D6827_00235 [Candidatus Parcubacteria bacterium]